MATVADLERTQSLVNRLTALGNVQRGDVIRAQQWNELVSIVISLAQALLATQGSDSVPPHDHPDQVKLSWLDPSLRSLIEKGPLSDPNSVAKVVEVDRKVKMLMDDLHAVRGAATSAHDRLAELSTREVIRDQTLSEVRRVVEVTDQRKDAIGELRRSLGSIQSKVDQAIDAGSRLVVDGTPVDMKVIEQRLKSVEELRSKLTLGNGSVLDANTFETRIATIRGDVVTQRQLDDALKLRVLEVPKETLDSVRDSVTTAVRGEFTVTFASLKGEIDTNVDKKLAAVEGTVAQKIEDRLPTAIGAAVNEVKTQIATTAEQVRGEARAVAEDRAAKAAAAVRADVTNSIAGIQSAIPASVNAALDATLPGRFAAVEGTAGAARAAATDALAKIDAATADLSTAKARTAQVALQNEAAIRNLETALTTEMNRRDAAGSRDLAKRLSDLSTEADARVGGQINTRLTQFQGELNATVQRTAAEAANTALRSTTVQLRAEMSTIARDQALALKDTVRASVVADLDSTITSKVNAAVRTRPVAGGGTVVLNPDIVRGGGAG